MWIWKITAGRLYYYKDPAAGILTIGQGYSGDAEHQNQLASVELHNQGPIPPGIYLIGAARDLEGSPHGPFVIPLQPLSVNEMYGRTGFLMHGGKASDEPGKPGTASEGCICTSRPNREKVNASPDKILTVIP